MRTPFRLFSSQGLGTSFSSLHDAPLLDARPLNASDTRLDINAATGNAVVTDTLFHISDQNLSLTLGMIWNANDKEKPWRFAATAKIQEDKSYFTKLSHLVSAATLTLTEADGRKVIYQYDEATRSYVSTEVGIHGTVRITVRDDKTYERQFPGLDYKEIYTSAGQLDKRVYATGQVVSYAYDANGEVCAITLPSTRIIQLLPTKNNSAVRELSITHDGKQQLIARYGFDHWDKPTTLTTEIPQPDGSFNQTTYAYAQANANSATFTITASDQSKQSLTFDQGKLAKLQEGVAERQWTFEHDTTKQVLRAKDATQQTYEVTYDSNKMLSGFKTPTDSIAKQFVFQANGQLTSAKAADNSEQQYTYDKVSGLRTTHLDACQRQSTYVYDTNLKSPQYGMMLAKVSTEKGVSETQYFVYDDQRVCRYSISSSTRVVRYVYDAQGKCIVVQKPASIGCDVVSNFDIKNPETFSLKVLEEWWATNLTSEHLSQCEITEIGYDDFGRENKRTTFDRVNEKGEGVLTETTAIVSKVLDAVGQAVQIDTNTAYDAKRKTVSQKIAYDGLSRVTSLTEAVESPVQRQTTHAYVGNAATTTHASGLITQQVQDAGGLVSSEQRSVAQQTRVLSYQRDARGAVTCQTREDGQKVYQQQDAAGRLQFHYTPDGKLSCYAYDLNQHVTYTATYVIANLNPSDPKFDFNDAIAKQTPLHEHYTFFDNESQLRYEVTVKDVVNEKGDSERLGYVTEYDYLLARKTKKIEYNNAITNPTQLTYEKVESFCENDFEFIKSNKKVDGRITQYMIDPDGYLYGEQQQVNDSDPAMGYLTQYERDGVDRVARKIVYLTPLPMLNPFNTPDIAKLPQLVTYYRYDNAGRKIAQLDPDRYLTTYSYYANGKLKAENTFKDRIPDDKGHLATLNLPTPDVANDRTLSYEYDDLGRESKITNSQSQLEIVKQYDVDDHVIATIMTDLVTKQTRLMQKQFNPFGELQCDADARLSASVGDDQSKWTHHDRHPVTGLLLRTIDAFGNITRYYYDAARRPVCVIAADGAVTYTTYDATCAKPTTIHQYAIRMDIAALNKLIADKSNDGFMSDLVTQCLPQISDGDHITTNSYDGDGWLIKTIAPTQAADRNIFNRYGEITANYKAIDASQTLKTTYAYDMRGNQITVCQDPEGAAVKTTKVFADALNRPTQITDASQKITNITYTGLREEVRVDASVPERKQTICHDAFMRTQSETDWQKQITTHTYANDKRSELITSPEGRTCTKVRNAFSEVTSSTQGNRTTQYEYGVDGQIEKTIHPDGGVEFSHYDDLGRKDLVTTVSGKQTTYAYDAIGNVNKKTDTADGNKRETTYSHDALGQVTATTAADSLQIATTHTHAGLIITQTTDPDQLKLLTTTIINFAGGVESIIQGDVTTPLQYQERVKRDVFNREIAREVDMGTDTAALVLSQQAYDVAGHVVQTTDGNGNSHYKVYDVYGDCRFEIDAKGFVIEKQYNANHLEVYQRCYQTAIDVTQLPKPFMVDAIAKVVKASDNDSVRRRYYDNDQLLRFELNFTSEEKGNSVATVIEWQRNEYGDCQRRIEYAAGLIHKEEVLTTALIAAYVKEDDFAKHPRNRATDFAYDTNGYIRFTRDAEGYVVEKRRDTNGRVIAIIQYAQRYADIDFKAPSGQIAKNLSLNDVDNRINFYVYDSFGNIAYDIDPAGFTKYHEHNAVDLQTATTAYYHSLATTAKQEDLQKLYQQLLQQGSERNTSTLLTQCAALVSTIADASKDVTGSSKYDAARRLEKTVDGENNAEIYQRDALGLMRTRTDKCGAKWTYTYDLAKRLKNEISPKVDVTTLQQDPQTNALTAKTDSMIVGTTIGYDNASNKTRITYAINTTDSRSVATHFDANNRVSGTTIENVNIDDGTDVFPVASKRPETNVNINTITARDYAGREVVGIDESGHPHFTVYDRLGRTRFAVDGDGYVTEWVYDFSFEEPTHIIQHAVALDANFLKPYLQTGIPENILVSQIASLDQSQDRKITFVHDKRGLKTSAVKDSILSVTLKDDEVIPSSVAPKTTWQHNAFAQVIKEQVLIDASGQVATQAYRYDLSGNTRLTISPNGYITTQQHGMSHKQQDEETHILLKQVAYANALPANTDWDASDAELIKAIAGNPKDRTTDYVYNQRLLVKQTTVSSQEVFHKLDANKKVIADTNAVTTGMEYDGEGRVTAYINTAGEKRYLFRDARGDVMYETEFPIQCDMDEKQENGDAKKHIPLTQHLINAHRQKIGTIRFVSPASIDMSTGKATLVLPPAPPVNAEQNHQTLLLMDRRGSVIVTQTPTGHLKYTTYDAHKKPVRQYRWITGYQLVNGVPTKVKNLSCVRHRYNNRHQAIMQATIDGQTEVQTHKQMNAFGECTAEGPSADKMVLSAVFDKAGNKWFSNEDQGIATLYFPDARGMDVVMCRSHNVDLRSYQNNQDAAARDLLGNYLANIKRVQRTILQRDHEGNVTEQQTPWYRVKPKTAPGNLQQTFVTQALPQGMYITWQLRDDTLLLTPVFKIRVKGASDWQVMTVETISKDLRGINIASLTTDMYEYCLEFYFKDPDTNELDEAPSYRSEGETVLDTGNYQQSKNVMWYMRDDVTLILCGKLDDISGVALCQHGKEVKRLAGIRNSAGQLVIELSTEFAGDYDIKAVKGYQASTVIATTQQVDGYTLNYYNPIYQFTAQGSMIGAPTTMPPQITSVVAKMKNGAAPVPSFTYNYNCRKKDYRKDIPAAATLPSAFLYGLDINQQSYFLGYFVVGSRVNQPEWRNYYNGHPEQLAGCTAQPFYLLTSTGTTEPHGLLVNGTLNPLRVWANHSYRLLANQNVNAPAIQSQVVTLDQAPLTDTLGTIALRSAKRSATMTAREISINNLHVKNYTVSGYFNEHHGHVTVAHGTPKTYYHYEWQTNISSDNHLIVSHNGIKAEVSSLNGLPSTQAYGVNNPMYFQVEYSNTGTGPSVGPMDVQLVTDEGDVIPMGFNVAAVPTVLNHDRTPAVYFDSHVQYDGCLVEQSNYADLYTLYFRPVPSNLQQATVEISVTSDNDSKIWHSVPAVRTTNGFAVDIESVPPGEYYYRFMVPGQKDQAVDLSSVGISYDRRHGHGSVLIKKGYPGNQLFVSKGHDDVLELKKPKLNVQYDRWRNKTSVSDRRGNATTYAFNLLNKEISKSTPTVTAVDKSNNSQQVALVTQTYVNVNGVVIAEAQPSGAVKVRRVNEHGDTLAEIDADGVSEEYVWDVLHRKRRITHNRQPVMSLQYGVKDGLHVESRFLVGGTREDLTYNEDMMTICHVDRLKRVTYFQFDRRQQELLRINPLRIGQTAYTTQMQCYHPRTGVRTRLTDEDGNVQTWDTQNPNNPIDDYCGHVVTYTDLAGQVITYKRNNNKQVIEELGSVTAEVDKHRGTDHQGDQHAPPARNLRNYYDDAGHHVTIIDDGAQLVTLMRHDEDDYTISYYFTNRDGRVYQATYTDYDAIHRIVRVRDTRFIVMYGYDLNTNRRYARAYLADDSNQLVLRESWYDYTLADRVAMRDCVFDTKTGTIALAPQQGMKLSHVNGNIVEQVVLDADGKLQTKQLSYDDAMLLRDVLTYDDTNHMLSYMHRILDEGERCVDVSQNRGCVIKVRLDKPSKSEYMKYDQPTYVLTINPQPNNPHNWHLYYYKDAEENEIPLTNDESLQKIKEYLHDLEGRNANQLSPQEVAKLERLLRHFDAQSNGVTISDHTEFDTDDSIMSQRHHEKNPKIDKTNVREVTSKTATGRPLTEINHFSYHEEISKEQKIDFTVDDTNQSHYFKANDIKITDITVSRTTHGDVQKNAVPPIAKVNNTNDANGNITSTVGALPDSFRSFVVNSENAIVYKTAGNKGKNYYFYAEKRPGKMVLMAYFGDIPDSVRNKLKPADIVKLEQPPVINVDVNHEPLSSQYPPALPSQFTVPSDMTYNQIADELNYTGYGATLAAANGGEPNDLVHAHTTIHIPSLYYEVPETAWNGSMPSIDKIIGGMYPNLPMPTIRMKPPQHADFLELALEAAAFAAVMVIAPEALAGVMGYVMAYGIAGAMASAASQGIAMGFGTQHGFDMKAMARDAILSAVSAGLGPKLGVMKGTFDAAALARNVATAEAVALAQQALLLGTGLQKRPNWQQMIAAAFSSTLSTTTSATLGNGIAEASVNTFANSLGEALVTTGRLDMTAIAANTLGSMVGTGLGNVVEDQVSKMALERVQPKVSAAATKPATKIGNASARATAEALKRVVETPAVVSDASETGLEMELASYTPLNVPDPTLPLGDTIHSDAVTYELSEMNSQRMQAARASRLARWNGGNGNNARLLVASTSTNNFTIFDKLAGVGAAAMRGIVNVPINIYDELTDHPFDPVSRTRREAMHVAAKIDLAARYMNAGYSFDRLEIVAETMAPVVFLRAIGGMIPKIGSSVKTPLVTESSEVNLTVEGNGVAKTVADTAPKAVNPRVEKMAKVIEGYLGKDFKMFKNKSGDPIFMSNDNTRKIRFDAMNPHGYQPHGHVEIFEDGKWTDYIPRQHHIYLNPKVEPDLLPPTITK